MKVLKVYTKYQLIEGDKKIRVKISKDSITLCNKNALYPNEFQFLQSKPEIISFFAKAMKQAVKLSEEERNDEEGV